MSQEQRKEGPGGSIFGDNTEGLQIWGEGAWRSGGEAGSGSWGHGSRQGHTLGWGPHSPQSFERAGATGSPPHGAASRSPGRGMGALLSEDGSIEDLLGPRGGGHRGEVLWAADDDDQGGGRGGMGLEEEGDWAGGDLGSPSGGGWPGPRGAGKGWPGEEGAEEEEEEEEHWRALGGGGGGGFHVAHVKRLVDRLCEVGGLVTLVGSTGRCRRPKYQETSAARVVNHLFVVGPAWAASHNACTSTRSLKRVPLPV